MTWTLHYVWHCTTDTEQKQLLQEPLTTSIKVMTNAMPLCPMKYFNKVFLYQIDLRGASSRLLRDLTHLHLHFLIAQVWRVFSKSSASGRYRDGLVWTESLTLEVKLRFSNSPAQCDYWNLSGLPPVTWFIKPRAPNVTKIVLF